MWPKFCFGFKDMGRKFTAPHCRGVQMWQRFSERARRVVFFAQEEAARMGQNYVSTEHLLLGLAREDDSLAARILDRSGVSLRQVRAEVERQVTRGEGRLKQDIQLTPRAKRVIDLAYDESKMLGHDYIGTEHLLLGLIGEGEGVAGRVLQKLGVKLERVRAEVVAVVGDSPKKEHEIGRESKLESRLTENISEAVRVMAGKAHLEIAPLCSSEAGQSMAGKDLLEIADLSRDEIDAIFEVTRKLKENICHPLNQRAVLAGKTLAMIFEKQSLRTRVSFETGIFQLGGHGIYLQPADISLGKRESIADVSRTLSGMVDMIMARTFAHETVTELAKYADVPVINGLSDLEHPCQALADFYTILEKKGDLAGRKLAFIGDGNNVAHSLMLLAAKVGVHFAIGCPKGYEPMESITGAAVAFAKDTGAKIEVLNDPFAAAENADVVYTDVWASMGQESEAAEREKAFANFQVNAELMQAAKPDAIFEHCLPAHRGLEVTAEVIDSDQSVVFQEAENRLHVQKAVMALVGRA